MFSRAFQQPFSPAFDRGGVRNGLLTGLIGYWPCNEAAGANNALDLHTNALTLTQIHSPGSMTGKVYSAARTGDGANDYFDRAAETLLNTGDVDFTVGGWCYPAAASSMIPICKNLPTGNQREWAIFYNGSGSDGTFSFQVSRDGTGAGTVSIVTTTRFAINAWYLVLGWHDSVANTINVWVGSEGTTYSVSHTLGVLSSTAPLRFMANGNSNSFWNGGIGPKMYWKTVAGGGGVLTATQRTAAYNGGAGLAYAAFTA